MPVLILQGKLKLVREYKFFSTITDEGTDVSNKEQISFFLRTMDQNLNSFEDFMGFYELENAKSDTISCLIKDILSRTHLILDDCKVQTYNDARHFCR